MRPFFNEAQTASTFKLRDQTLSVQGFLNSLNLENFYSYDGSLTTPPCTEGIKWAVLQKIQPISDEQLSWFTTRWAGNATFSAGNGNNRATQPLNKRTVWYSSQNPNPDRVAVIVLSVFFGVSIAALLILIFTMFICPKKLLKTCLERDQDINLVSPKEKNIEFE